MAAVCLSCVVAAKSVGSLAAHMFCMSPATMERREDLSNATQNATEGHHFGPSRNNASGEFSIRPSRLKKKGKVSRFTGGQLKHEYAGTPACSQPDVSRDDQEGLDTTPALRQEKVAKTPMLAVMKGGWLNEEEVLEMEQSHGRELRVLKGQWDDGLKLFELEQRQCGELKHKEDRVGTQETRDNQEAVSVLVQTGAVNLDLDEVRKSFTKLRPKTTTDSASQPSWVQGHSKAKQLGRSRTARLRLENVKPFKSTHGRQKKCRVRGGDGDRQEQSAWNSKTAPLLAEIRKINQLEQKVGSRSASKEKDQDANELGKERVNGKASNEDQALSLLSSTKAKRSDGEPLASGLKQQQSDTQPFGATKRLDAGREDQATVETTDNEILCKLRVEEHVPASCDDEQHLNQFGPLQGHKKVQTFATAADTRHSTVAAATEIVDKRKDKNIEPWSSPCKFSMSNANHALKLLQLSQQQQQQQQRQQRPEIVSRIVRQEATQAAHPAITGCQHDSAPGHCVGKRAITPTNEESVAFRTEREMDHDRNFEVEIDQSPQLAISADPEEVGRKGGQTGTSSLQPKEIKVEHGRSLNLCWRKVAHILQGSLRKQVAVQGTTVDRKAEKHGSYCESAREMVEGQKNRETKDNKAPVLAAQGKAAVCTRNKEVPHSATKEMDPATEEQAKNCVEKSTRAGAKSGADQQKHAPCSELLQDSASKLAGIVAQHPFPKQTVTVKDNLAENACCDKDLVPAEVDQSIDNKVDLVSLLERLRRPNGRNQPLEDALPSSALLDKDILTDPAAVAPPGEAHSARSVWLREAIVSGHSHGGFRTPPHFDDVPLGALVGNKKKKPEEDVDSFSCGSSSACEDTDTATVSTAGGEEEVMDYDSVTDQWVSLGWRENEKPEPPPQSYSLFCCFGQTGP